MKKRVRLLAGAFVVLALLTAVLVFMRMKNESLAENEAEELIIDLTADEISRIRVIRNGDEICAYERSGGVWKDAAADAGEASVVDMEEKSAADAEEASVVGMEEKSAVDAEEEAATDEEDAVADAEGASAVDAEEEADQEKASKLAASVTGVAVTHKIEGVTDLGQYGLSEPQAVIEITAVSGQETVLEIGDVNSMTLDVYCLKDGRRDVVYAVSTALVAEIEGDA